MVLPVGSKISIQKKVYRICQVNFALDYSDDPQSSRMRCNVELVKLP
jgi:hypothetical protein